MSERQPMARPDYFAFTATLASRQRDRVRAAAAPVAAVRVSTTVLAPNGERVPCGEVTCARCDADVFDPDVLTLTAHATGYTVRVFAPGTWTEAICYDTAGAPLYVLYPSGRIA